MNRNDIRLLELFYNEAIGSQKKTIKFGDFKGESLGYFGRLKAKRAIDYFQKVLDVEPDNFLVLFFIGKNYQSLRQFDKAFYYLERSVDLNFKDPILPFEASIVAMHLNLTDKSIGLIKEAIKRKPEDEEFLAVYAMYLIIAGEFSLSQTIINQAFAISPRNNFIIELKVVIDAVNLGHLTQPTLHSLFNR